MPRRVRFVGHDNTDPKRPRLVYEVEGGEQIRIPNEMLNSPMGASSAADHLAGRVSDSGPGSEATTGDTFVGYQGSEPVYANNYTGAGHREPGGAQMMRAPLDRGGQQSRVTYGPPSPEQTRQYGTTAAESGMWRTPELEYDLKGRAELATKMRQAGPDPDAAHAAAIKRLRAQLGLGD